jgi:hypothetical protein
MKALKCLLVAGLALASSFASRADTSAQSWLESYYLNPRPAELTRSVRELSRSGWLDQSGHTPLAIGFLSSVFAQNAQRVDGWVKDLADLPRAHRSLVASAVWQSGHPSGAALLRELSANSPMRGEIEKLVAQPATAVLNTPVLSPSSMNLQWGAFLASGNDRNVVAILAAMGADRPGLDLVARQSLAANAVAHPRVMEICRVQLDRQPESVRAEIRAALQAAGAKPGV